MAEKSIVLARYKDPAQYRKTFMGLTKEDGDYERQVVQEEVEKDLQVTWNSFGSKLTVISGLHLGVGDDVLLTHPASMWERRGKVEKVEDSLRGRKFTLSVAGVTGWGVTDHNSGFQLAGVYNTVVLKRKMAALMAFTTDSQIPSFMVDLLVRGNVDAIPATKFPIPLTASDNLCAPGVPVLNPPQAHAVRRAVGFRLSLIHGPPGTGKTNTTVHIVHLLHSHGLRKFLVVAPSNAASDQLAAKISLTKLNVVRVMSKKRQDVATTEMAQSLHRLMESVKSSPELSQLQDEQRQGGRLTKEKAARLVTLLREKELSILSDADVIVTTVIGSGSSRLSSIQFDVVVVDEAGMLTEPDVLVPLARPAQFYLLVGDHAQLGPTVKCKAVQEAGLGQSLFLRLVLLGLRAHRLELQYRMSPEIAALPNKLYYQGFVKDAITAEDRVMPGDLHWLKPTMMYHVVGTEEVIGTSIANDAEVESVEKILTRLIEAGVSPSDIGVISPYSLQQRRLREFLDNSGKLRAEKYGVTIGPVEAFQGAERDFIIVSVTRSNNDGHLGFLSDSRRLTVALTRAKKSLIVVANTVLLAQNEAWAPVVDHYRKRDRLMKGPLDSLEVSTEADGVVAYVPNVTGGPSWSIERQLKDEKSKKQRVE